MKLAAKRPAELRPFLSEVLRGYASHAGVGLPARNPISVITRERGLTGCVNDRIILPMHGLGDGGTSAGDVFVLASVARLIKPKVVFEIGTFNGYTASVFLMNTDSDTTVYSLDLPTNHKLETKHRISSDLEFINRRKLASLVHAYGQEQRFCQLLGDSMQLDPAPYRGAVGLGFIDGAHDYRFVRNDTEKMAAMMTENGFVFWHDYGGQGRFRPLSDYLERLARVVPIYRVPDTSLAWSRGKDLCRCLRS